MRRDPAARMVARRVVGALRARGAMAGLLLALGLAGATEARGAVSLYDGDQGKLDLEIRLMAWAVDAGPDLAATVSGTPAEEGNVEDFFVRRARLLLRAQVSRWLEIYLQAGQDNIGSTIARDDAGFRFKDAAINWKHRDGLMLAVGQFKVPFLRQSLETGFNQLLVDRALVTALRPAIEGSRDQGGMIWGNHQGLQYRVALFDGSDQEDTNTRSSLRTTARVSWNWFTPETGPGYTGTTFGKQKVLQVGGQADAQNDRVDPKDQGFETEPRDYRAWAADFFYEQPFSGNWALCSEGAWVERRDDYQTDGLATRTLDGGYVQAGLLLPPEMGPGRLQVAGRYESLETEVGGTRSSVRARTFGLTWFVKGHDRKIQFDHTTSHERPVDLDSNASRLSFVAMF